MKFQIVSMDLVLIRVKKESSLQNVLPANLCCICMWPVGKLSLRSLVQGTNAG